LTKVAVMGLSGVLGIITSRLIISHYGLAAYAQYGLLTTMSTLLPFYDLGVGAVVLNAVAESQDPGRDAAVQRTITTALRVLLGSGVVIAIVGTLLRMFGAWPAVMGHGLLPGDGETAAALCFVVLGVFLPFTIGQRILLGLQRSTTLVAAQGVVSPLMFVATASTALLAVPLGGYLAVVSYLANAAMWVICWRLGARALGGDELLRAVRDVPRLRRVRGVPIGHTAWPVLAQMLALPIALQSDRLLLSHLTTHSELARYNLAAQLFGLVLQTVSTAGVAMWPIFARARAGSQVMSPARAVVAFLLVGLGLGGGLAAVSPWVADFVSHGRTSLDGWLVGGFVAFVVVQAINYPLGMYMTDSRGLRFQVPPILAMVPLNLGLSWWLTRIIGAGGPIIGSAISVLACQVVTNAFYVRRDLGRRRRVPGSPPSEPGRPSSDAMIQPDG
jgi:O-antigen/teichoic acid export membrane protein